MEIAQENLHQEQQALATEQQKIANQKHEVSQQQQNISSETQKITKAWEDLRYEKLCLEEQQEVHYEQERLAATINNTHK